MATINVSVLVNSISNFLCFLYDFATFLSVEVWLLQVCHKRRYILLFIPLIYLLICSLLHWLENGNGPANHKSNIPCKD